MEASVEYIGLSGTDLVVSRLCLGGWQIGGRSFGFMPDDEVRAILMRSLDLGITFFDVAPCYGRGRAEELVGRMLADISGITIATKVGLRWGADEKTYFDLSKNSIHYEVERTLRRLRRDTIDLYQVHWPDPKTPLEETFGTLEELRRSGKVRYLGVCNYSHSELKEIRSIAEISTLQSRYNLLERESEPDIAYCDRMRMPFIAHSSLATGLLTGKYDASVQFEDARNRYEMYKGEGLARALECVEYFKKEAHEKGKSLIGYALHFILNTPGVSCAIVGTRSPEQIEGVVRDVGMAE